MAQIGVINEIGDMGLGFDPLSEKDQRVYNEQQQQQAKDQNGKNDPTKARISKW